MEKLRIYFAVPEAVHLLDLTGPAHIFYELQERRPDVELYFLKIELANIVVSSAGLGFANLSYFADFSLSVQDILFIPGLSAEYLTNEDYLRRCQAFFSWLRQQVKQGATVCSVCTGAFFLGVAGLLTHKKCTIHWRYWEQFSSRFPSAQLQPDRLFVEDAGVISCAGVTSGIDLALYLIASRLGPEMALTIAREVVVYLRRSGGDPQLSIFLQFRNHLDDRIHLAQDYMVTHLSEGCHLPDLARRHNMSVRNFSRRFKKETGITPVKYLTKIRAERARQLLAEGRKFAEIAGAVGLKSSSQLKNILAKEAG